MNVITLLSFLSLYFLYLLIANTPKLFPNLKLLNLGSYNNLLEINQQMCDDAPIVVEILSKLYFTITFIMPKCVISKSGRTMLY